MRLGYLTWLTNTQLINIASVKIVQKILKMFILTLN